MGESGGRFKDAILGKHQKSRFKLQISANLKVPTGARRHAHLRDMERGERVTLPRTKYALDT
jgi:hypothetical protein